MRIVSFILPSQPDVISTILQYLRHEFLPPPSTGPPRWLALREAEQYWQQHPEFLPPPDTEADFEQAFPPDDHGVIDLDAD